MLVSTVESEVTSKNTKNSGIKSDILLDQQLITQKIMIKKYIKINLIRMKIYFERKNTTF